MNYRWGGQWSRKRIFMAKNRPKMTQILVWDWKLDLKQWKCDARTISDARGSNDARGTPLIPTTHPRFASARPVVPPKGATTVPKFFVLGLFELRSVHGSTIWEKCVVDRPHTSPQPTRGDGQLKKLYNIVGLQDGNVTCGHNWMVPDGSHAQI